MDNTATQSQQTDTGRAPSAVAARLHISIYKRSGLYKGSIRRYLQDIDPRIYDYRNAEIYRKYRISKLIAERTEKKEPKRLTRFLNLKSIKMAKKKVTIQQIANEAKWPSIAIIILSFLFAGDPDIGKMIAGTLSPVDEFIYHNEPAEKYFESFFGAYIHFKQHPLRKYYFLRA